MKLNLRDITHISAHITMELGDPEYAECAWADFIINPASLTMSIRFAGGNMQCTWQSLGEGHSPAAFYCSLAKISREHFLLKLSDRSAFDLEASIKETCALVQDSDYLSATEKRELMSDIRQIHANSEAAFYEAYSACRNQRSDFIFTANNYPAVHQAIADIFVHYVAPALLELVPPATDAIFVECHESYSTKALITLASKLDISKQYVPFEVEGQNSCAFGFIEESIYEAQVLSEANGYHGIKLFQQQLADVLNDINQENPDHYYAFAGIKTYLYR